jgi:hypothetical protein
VSIYCKYLGIVMQTKHRLINLSSVQLCLNILKCTYNIDLNTQSLHGSPGLQFWLVTDNFWLRTSNFWLISLNNTSISKLWVIFNHGPTFGAKCQCLEKCAAWPGLDPEPTEYRTAELYSVTVPCWALNATGFNLHCSVTLWNSRTNFNTTGEYVTVQNCSLYLV